MDHQPMQQTGLQTHLELAALPTAVPCARGHVRSVALEWGLADLADTAELVASEMATNAIQGSGRLRTAVTPVVRLWVTSDGVSMVIHVWDASDEMPVRQEAGPDDDSGRGLMIIDALSKDWGAFCEERGKVVWAMITSPWRGATGSRCPCTSRIDTRRPCSGTLGGRQGSSVLMTAPWTEAQFTQ
jgi:anti-sigma regulatory factor (Ser/Thr protein kinase)